MKRLIVWFACFALLFTQTYALAGPHEEGVAAGQAANPAIKGQINTPSASTNVPNYTTTPPQSSLYKAPNLPAQANAQLIACTLTPTDPACQAQQTAITSANTPRPAIGPYDPSVAAARDIARNPGTVLGDLASYYSGCTTSTVTTPPGTVNRMCNRYTGIGTYSCRRDLTVDVKMTPSCEIGSWFAKGQADRNGADHMYAQAQCRISTDNRQRFQFYAEGGHGACTDWQAVWLPRSPITEPTVATDLSPHWAGYCWSPFKVVAMPGSGCTGGTCNYNFQFGTPVYECPAGTIPGDQLLVGTSGETAVPGSPAMCYGTTPPVNNGEGMVCPTGTFGTTDLGGTFWCVAEAGSGKIIGASGWTIPLSFVEPHMDISQTDQWDDKCPVLDPAGRCTVTTPEQCVDGPGTKDVGGVDVTRSCWAYEKTMSCTAGVTNDECAPLVAAGCTPSGSACVKTNPITGMCAQYQDTYQCPSTGEAITTASNCPSNVFCMGTSCFNIAYTADADFARSMSYMEAAREAGIYMDIDKLKVFSGERNDCRDRLLKNCCYSDGAGKGMTNQSAFGTGSRLVYDILMNSENRDFVTAGLSAMLTGAGFSGTFSTYGFTIAVNGAALPAGSTVLYSSSAVAGEGVVVAFDPWSLVIAIIIYVIMQLMSCDEQEGRLALQKGAGLCHEIGSWCSHRVLGACVTETHSNCCFNSVLSRIINEQGRSQVGRGWGDVQNPNCEGFTIAELQSLNFAAMDFTEFYASIVPIMPNVTGIQGNNASRVPACYYGQGKC